MELLLNDPNFDYINMDLNKINVIIGGNSSGKSLLLNSLFEGFSGKMKDDFLIDGTEVKKNQYYVLYIGESKLFEVESKLGARSLLKSKIDISLELLEEEAKNKFKDAVTEYTSEIKSKLISEFQDFNLNLEFEMDKLITSINKSMVFDVNSTPTEFLSQSEQSEMLINFYLEDMMSVNNKCILFIDNFGQEFSDYKFKEILHKVINKVKNKDITIITTSKNEIDIDQSIVKKFYLKNRKLKDQVNLDDYVLSISNVVDMDELERLYSQNEIFLAKEKIYFALALPTKNGGFIMKPLSTKLDPTGFEASKKYLSNTEVAKLVKSSNEYFSNPQNRQFGRLITERLPEDYNQVDFSPFFNNSSNQSKPKIKTTSRK